MTAAPLMSVGDALARVLAAAGTLPDSERVPVAAAFGRTLASDLPARRTQPPVAVSAMDGYAVRSVDLGTLPRGLTVVGESAAGRRFRGTLNPGEAVRIFTGAPLPEGADAVLIQENARREGTRVLALEGVAPGRHVRPAGHDFTAGEIGLPAGRRLGVADVALAAAMNHAEVAVVRKPRVAILSTGDELVAPGQEPLPDQIVASNDVALAAIVRAAGGEALPLGIAADDLDALAERFAAARSAGADVLLTLGGASVGDHDLVQRALVREGLALDFWRIAMRPGKPLMHGRLGALQVLGLPGNPVSAIVCGLLFAYPLVRALCGDPSAGSDPSEAATLGSSLPPNDGRQDYLRGKLDSPGPGEVEAIPVAKQDSSLLKALSRSDCLVVRRPHAPAARAGDACRIIRLARFRG